MSKTNFIKSISELTKETAQRIKDGKIVVKSNDPKVQKAITKKVDDLTAKKPKKMKTGGMTSKGYRSGGMASKGYRSGGMIKSKGSRSGGKRRGVGVAKRGFGKALK